MAVQKTTIHLSVLDTDRSIAFYQALLGVMPAERGSAGATFDLESPPLVLILEARSSPTQRAAPANADLPRGGRKRRGVKEFTFIVNEPRHVGEAAVALRRAGARLRLEDSGIAVSDPDDNAWRVRWVPTDAHSVVLAP